MIGNEIKNKGLTINSAMVMVLFLIVGLASAKYKLASYVLPPYSTTQFSKTVKPSLV